ncbi:hypothetical protein TWF696_005357 [Orbilia brochopaga]|uniref:deoxyribose-phosphate aldolase n=1 Tax=Orbilia brochopaga TaxID=3140254 RepID=A0AAV9V0P6_9PEZI
MSESKPRLSPTATSFAPLGGATTEVRPRSNEELTPLVDAHIKLILSTTDDDTTDFAPSFDLMKPSSDLAACIDHTLLKPDATPEQVFNLVQEAMTYGFKSCCVNGSHIPYVTSTIAAANSSKSAANVTIPCAVIGFPLGASATAAKVYETTLAILDGAREIDMVMSIGHLKARDYAAVYNDIARVVRAAKSGPASRPATPPVIGSNTSNSSAPERTRTPPTGTNHTSVPVKVIIETSLLTTEEKIAACYLASIAGAAFVKTSTGFGGGGATVDDVRLMRRTVGFMPAVQVKASGGIKTFEQCVALLKAGAHRIGASSGVSIMKSGDAAQKESGETSGY